MKIKLITSLLAAAAALTGVISATAPASAEINWGSVNTAPTKNALSQSDDFSNISTLIDSLNTQINKSQEKYAFPDLSLLGGKSFDLSKLTLQNDTDVRAYFVNEGADYNNQLGYQALDSNGNVVKDGLAFWELNSKESIRENSTSFTNLKQGDWVNLGNFSKGTTLNFQLNANSLYNTDNAKYSYGIYNSAFNASNPDGLQHAKGYLFNSRYLVIGFEDLYGDGSETGVTPASDRDFNDTVFIVDIGNQSLQSVPEPSATLALVAASTLGMFGLRRRRNSQING
ncbi:DUF4114 domain-containing protein [Coleofasciculus sp. FACHB-T130]|uniref:DUF4114 domain-containing protein n=1 Tax=Cyanophyceae TaxID=3028117 RepID=UPI00168269EA|nr:DUF4114 domain-containing protein [Coleofasciculus sp. FACHB-T130]MBD1882046.1 DUF4114 domain-containing protein [Coleofasciculus sp. FACHB-T130]